MAPDTQLPKLPGTVMVLGSKGMLGQAVMKRFGDMAVGLDIAECDITNPASVDAALVEYLPATVINCAAYTAVDKAEEEEELATKINGHAVGILAELTRKHDVHLITISTDYVFYGSGETPWPADAADEAYGPLNAYGRGKLEGERQVRSKGGRWTIARTQWLYGDGGPNFIKAIAKLASERDQIKVVNDQFGAVTWTRDVAEGLYKLTAHQAEGCFHLVNDGFGSWFEAACQIVEKLELNCIVKPCLTSEFPRPAARPANSRMSQSKFIQLTGAPLPKWQTALDQYLASSEELADFRTTKTR